MANEKKTFEISNVPLSLKLFQTFHVAVQPTKLIIAFLAVVIICLCGWIMDIGDTVVVSADGQTELDVYLSDPQSLELFIEVYESDSEGVGVFSSLMDLAFARFHGALSALFSLDAAGMVSEAAGYFRGICWALKYHFFYCLIFFVIKLAVISVAGGSLCRITALQFSRGEKPGLVESLRFSVKRFSSFFGAPLVPAGIIVFIGLFVFLLGLIGNIPCVGELVIGIVMPAVLLGGALMAVILIGAVAGFNLMFPAIAYDGSDCFDSISRAFSYVYARPWRMCFYSLIAGVYGSICYLFVRFFAFLVLATSHSFLGLGVFVDNSQGVDKLAAIWPAPTFMSLLGANPLAGNWAESFAAFLIHLFLLAVVGAIVAFVISFYFSANTIIYSLMRNRVDDTSLEEIYTGIEDSQTEDVSGD